ncbi:Alpha/Beta hydrolase protein [Xylaria arbuscula]|nr:Alpha/Beta hydrolase protein [Xylaria arbuscula]
MTRQSQPPEELKGFEGLSPGTYNTPNGSILSYSHTPASQHKLGAPILVLLHGWPQTRYIWRYAVPVLLERGHTLFVPDLPGYGYSTMSTVSASDLGSKSAHDRISVGFGILSAVRAVYGGDQSSSAGDENELQVVLIGHDRGGRVTQRLITASSPVPKSLKIRILGAVILDIVPYSAQWSAQTNPRASTKYWHWSFLPSKFSVPMIKAYGAGRFCNEIVAATAGSNEAGRKSLYAGGAVEHYAKCYAQDEVINGAAADYSAGAAEDWDATQEDIKEGRKVNIPLVVLHCEGLSSMHSDVETVWKQWTGPDAKLRVHALLGGVGHYLPEEAPEETNKYIVGFLDELGL